MNNTLQKPLVAAAIQFTSTPDSNDNLNRIQKFLREASQLGAELTVIPENFGFLGPESQKLSHAQSIENGPFIAAIREVAAQCNMAVIAGGIPEIGPDPGHVYNTSVFVGRSGEILGSYRKMHLFDIELRGGFSFKESSCVAPGEEPVVVAFEGWNVGLSVCYDLRFPEYYRALVEKGADILTVPAAFTLETGKDHWDILLRARAIENQAYVIAAGQFGFHLKGRVSWGKSCIIDPWGTILACAPESEYVVLSRLDPAHLEETRANLPCWSHRKINAPASE